MNLITYHTEFENMFGKNYEIFIGTSSKWIHTDLHRLGHKTNQAITSVRYLDCLEYNYDNTEITFSVPGNDDEKVYSSYHRNDKCDLCEKHRENVRKNKMLGVIIHPVGVRVQSTRERKIKWLQFQ